MTKKILFCVELNLTSLWKRVSATSYHVGLLRKRDVLLLLLDVSDCCVFVCLVLVCGIRTEKGKNYTKKTLFVWCTHVAQLLSVQVSFFLHDIRTISYLRFFYSILFLCFVSFVRALLIHDWVIYHSRQMVFCSDLFFLFETKYKLCMNCWKRLKANCLTWDMWVNERNLMFFFCVWMGRFWDRYTKMTWIIWQITIFIVTMTSWQTILNCYDQSYKIPFSI